MGALSFLGNVYFIAIVVLSFMVALIMSLQTQNDWYTPQHPACNSVKYSVEVCSNSQELEIKITVPRSPNDPVIQFKDSNENSLAEVEAGRTISIKESKTSTFEIIPYKDSYKCSRESTIIKESEILPC